MTRLLILLRDGADPTWLRLDGRQVAARGDGAPAVLEGGPVIAAVPGEHVVLHWAEMPELAPAQAAAAARLIAADVCAGPLAGTHVAIGPRDADGQCCLALADTARITDWLARCAAVGLDPDRIVPLPLLIPAPETGMRIAAAGDAVLVRGDRLALAAEPPLAALLTGDAPTETLDAAAFEAGLAAALDALPVDLRQGAFAKVQPWRVDWRLVRRLAAMAGLVLAVTLLVNFVLIWRYALAADVAELNVAAEARRILPRTEAITDPVAQVQARLTEMGAGGPGFSGAASALFAALRDVNGAQVTSLRYEAGGLTAAVATAQGGDIALIQERVRAAGYATTAGEPRTDAGRAVVELTVRAR